MTAARGGLCKGTAALRPAAMRTWRDSPGRARTEGMVSKGMGVSGQGLRESEEIMREGTVSRGLMELERTSQVYLHCFSGQNYSYNTSLLHVT